MFVVMGLQNAKRYANRTALAIAVVAGAALILTAALSTNSGFLQSTHLYLRSYLGADIIVLPGKFVFDEGDFAGSKAWKWTDYGPAVNELPGSLIRLRQDGYLARDGQATTIELDKLQEVIQRYPEITGVYPYYYLPGLVQLTGAGVSFAMPVRGRDLSLDQHWNLGLTLSRGVGLLDYEQLVARALAPTLPQLEQFAEREGEPICMLNAAAFPSSVEVPATGSMLLVQIPTYSAERQTFDYSHLHSFQLEVVGHFSVPAAAYDYEDAPEQAPYFWTNASLQLPLATWRTLAGKVGAPLTPNKLTQAGLLLENTVQATRLARELRAALPELTILTVTEMADLIPQAASQAGLPINMDTPVHLMTLLIASAIVASNAFLLVMQRRKEIAILKSMGAATWNIITMVLFELVTIALVASLAGAFIYRLFYAITMLYNQVPWTYTLKSSLLMMGQVVFALCLSTAVFGFIPAVKAATTPVMEVMRDA